jgi:hypothetical protein
VENGSIPPPNIDEDSEDSEWDFAIAFSNR